MPKRKLETPEAALRAIKQVHQHGVQVNESALRGVTLLADIPGVLRNIVVREGKHGEPRFYTSDQRKGPGRVELPRLRLIQTLERDAKTLAFKRSKRQMPVEAASRARQATSKRQQIEQAWRAFGLDSRRAAKEIAYRFDVGAAYVRKVRTEMRLTESME